MKPQINQYQRAPGLGKGHAECLLKHGLSLDIPLSQLLLGTDVPVNFLDDPYDISPSDELAIASNLLKHTDHCFSVGFELGLTYKITDLGIFGLTIMSCRNGAHAAEIASRYLSEAYNFTNIELHAKQSTVKIMLNLTTKMEDELGQFIIARDFGVIHKVSSYFLNRNDNMAFEVGFNFPYVNGMEKVANIFGCIVKHNQDSNYMLVDMQDLAIAPPFSNEMNALTLEASYQASLRKEAVYNMSLSEKISSYLLEHSIDVNKKTIADVFHMSERTLSRHLEKEGKTWRGLINKARLEKAEKLLDESDITLQQIAVEIGFANLSSFSHAFTKYKGISPSEYRKLLESMTAS